MKIDFLHNKIVASTVTEKWKESFTEGVLPKLQRKHGGDIEGIQMYEDYIADKFTVGKTFYYPLSVATVSGEIYTEWLSWEIKKGAFEDDVPFAYKGAELLEISLPEEVSTAFVEKVGAPKYFDEVTVKLRVETTAQDITILSGRYSQSFIDEMARQLTSLISSTMSISGLEDSSVELAIVFAPDTYMEHTSENVTYRRLLLVDKSSAPRDFWIKWTRLDGKGAYTVSDDVTAEDIVFELGENVPQKIKEKEYRFLTRAGKDKYHNAMGRKNVTEWRDVIKRAIRRGDLEKLPEPVAEEPVAVAEAIVEEPAAAEPAVIETAAAVSEDDELALAMEMARRAMESVKDDVAPVEEEEEEEELDELEQFYMEDAAPVASPRTAVDEDEARELEELTRMAMEALRMAAQQESDTEDEPETVAVEPEDEPSLITFAEEEKVVEEATVIVPEDPIAEEYEGFEEIEDEEALEDEEILADVRALEPEETEAEDIAAPAIKAEPAPKAESGINAADLEAKIRSELEAKIRLEYESEARRRAEEEAERLRREQEQLKRENERLADRARREKEERAKAEEARVAETERLRAQIEAQVRQEAKERERIAEAARQAIEEKNRLEAERLQNERMKLEAERRAEEERRRHEEQERIEAQKRAEAERLRRAEEERLAKEKAAEVEEKGYVDNNYTYISKTVRLIFRRAVDPNVTARIHEILKATLEYYGKQKVYMRIKATVPNSTTVCLEFVQFPREEMELLSNIIKVIGNSGLGIMKAILE